jgi:lysophospholipase L1-like esterase
MNFMNRKMQMIVNICLMSSVFFVSTLVMDRLLSLLGYPSDYVSPVAHPPNYTEVREFLDYSYTFQTNSQGLRNREIPLEKPKGTYRIFVVGDSFTEGIGMENNATIPALLEARISSMGQQVNFINGGLAGTGPYEYARLLFSLGLKYQSNAALIFFFANDLNGINPDASTEELFENLDSFPKRTGVKKLLHFLYPRTYTILRSIKAQRDYNLRTTTSDFIATISEEAKSKGISETEIKAWQTRIPQNLVEAVEDNKYYGAALAYGLLYPQYYTDALDIASTEAELKWQKLDWLLSEIVSRSGKLGLEVAIVYLPDRLQYDPSRHNSQDVWRQAGVKVRSQWLNSESEVQIRLKYWADTHQVPFFDLTSTFRRAIIQNKKPLTWNYDHHWTAEGNRVAAEAIAEWIKTKHIFGLYD